MNADKDIKERIIAEIQKSNEEGPLMNRILYRDVMDIVFFYLSLAMETRKINMSTSDFYCLSEEIWKKWVRKNNGFSDLFGAYWPGPGPMGGTASSAEIYLSYCIHLSFFDTIKDFLTWQKSYKCGWLYHRDNVVIPLTLPKWKRKKHFKKIEPVLILAESICREMERSGAKT